MSAAAAPRHDVTSGSPLHQDGDQREGARGCFEAFFSKVALQIYYILSFLRLLQKRLVLAGTAGEAAIVI
jgi:hypothetical protein